MLKKLLLILFCIILASCSRNQSSLGNLEIINDPVEEDSFVFETEAYEEDQGLKYTNVKLNNFGIELSVPVKFQTILDNSSYHYFVYRNNDELQHIEISVAEVFNSDVFPGSLEQILENGEEYFRNSFRYHHDSGRIYEINDYFPLRETAKREVLFGEETVYVPSETNNTAPWTPYIEYSELPEEAGFFIERNRLIGEKATQVIRLGGQGRGTAYINVLFKPWGDREYIITVLSPEPSKELNDQIFDHVINSIDFFEPKESLSGVSYVNSDELGPKLVLPRGWQLNSSGYSLFLEDLDLKSSTYGVSIYAFTQGTDVSAEEAILNGLDYGDYISKNGLYMSDFYEKDGGYGIINIRPYISALAGLPTKTVQYPAVVAYKTITDGNQNYVVAVVGKEFQKDLLPDLIKVIH